MRKIDGQLTLPVRKVASLHLADAGGDLEATAGAGAARGERNQFVGGRGELAEALSWPPERLTPRQMDVNR